MKKTFLFLMSLFFFSFCFSQERGYLGITVGGSAPIGDFGSIEGDKVGCAIGGFTGDLSLSYRGTKQYGVYFALRLQVNPLDEKPFLDMMRASSTSVDWTAELGSWITLQTQIGLFVTLPINERISFDPRIALGLTVAGSPSIKMTTSSGGSSAGLEQKVGSSAAFSFSAGGNFKFNFSSERYALLVGADFYSCEPEFKDVEIVSMGSTEKSNFKQSIQTVSFNIGLGIRF